MPATAAKKLTKALRRSRRQKKKAEAALVEIPRLQSEYARKRKKEIAARHARDGIIGNIKRLRRSVKTLEFTHEGVFQKRAFVMVFGWVSGMFGNKIAHIILGFHGSRMYCPVLGNIYAWTSARSTMDVDVMLRWYTTAVAKIQRTRKKLRNLLVKAELFNDIYSITSAERKEVKGKLRGKAFTGDNTIRYLLKNIFPTVISPVVMGYLGNRTEFSSRHEWRS
jgi:hypothetical protein